MVEPAANPPQTAGGTGAENSLGFTLHVLCPSLPPPGRFSFNNLAASTSIAELKRLIQAKIPGNPVPESQRLIYSGRPVVDIGLTLQSILEPEEVRIICSTTIHETDKCLFRVHSTRSTSSCPRLLHPTLLRPQGLNL